MITKLIEIVYAFLWGDLFTIPVMGSSVGISLMLLLLIPAGVCFTIRTRLLPVRLFSDMMKALKEKKKRRTACPHFRRSSSPLPPVLAWEIW